MATISIVIPVYNHDKFIEESIESAYNQSIPIHEIIVVNDGSTDNSREIAERYMFRDFPYIESPVKVINQVNKGLSSARNTGIIAATGDYVLFLDADDILMENAVERITQEINNTGADVIAPSFREFGMSDREVILGGFTLADLKVANRLPYCCAIKRSVLAEIGGYSPRMKWGWEDYHLWFDIFSRGKSFAIIQEILFKYRVKDRSMIHEANEHAQELWAQIQRDFPVLFNK